MPTLPAAFAQRSFAAVLTALLLLSGCGGVHDERAVQPADSLTFVDDAQRTVVLDAPARRIVPLAPNLTEIAFAAGAGDRVVGVGTSDDYPAAVDTLPHISTLPVDFEEVATLRPDLILATDQINSPRDAETFDALGIPTAFFSFRSVPDIFAAVGDVGRLAGTPVRAQRAADSLRQAYAQLQERTRALPDRPRLLFLIGDETLYAFGRDSYVQDLIDAAGGESLTASIDRQAPVLSEEFVLEEQPDVIVGAWGEQYDTGRLADLHPGWQAVPALRNGRVHSVDPDLFLRPGPRVVEGAHRLAALLHPQSLAAADTTSGIVR